jgi:hypothetical protein
VETVETRSKGFSIGECAQLRVHRKQKPICLDVQILREEPARLRSANGHSRLKNSLSDHVTDKERRISLSVCRANLIHCNLLASVAAVVRLDKQLPLRTWLDGKRRFCLQTTLAIC